MNVLSLFDGMSCGQIALTELGCFPDKYYASEVDGKGNRAYIREFIHLIKCKVWKQQITRKVM